MIIKSWETIVTRTKNPISETKKLVIATEPIRLKKVKKLREGSNFKSPPMASSNYLRT